MEGARTFGGLLAREGLGLVYGGARAGLMGVLADAVLDNGGEVIGVIPEVVTIKERAHRGVTELRVVASMHERKATMAELADAFVALPGGLGTLDELCEILTWAMLGLHAKPCALLDQAGYWGPFLSMLDHAVACGFVRAGDRRLVGTASTPEAVLALLREAWARPMGPVSGLKGS